MTPRKKIEKIKVDDDLTKAWTKTNDLIDLGEEISAKLAELEQIIGTLKQQRIRRNFFPFCIYEFPYDLREDPGADDWRKVRIRGGTIFINGHEVEVSGTDAAEDPYNGDMGDPDDFSADILCDEDEGFYWFWIEIDNTDPDAPTASIQSGGPAVQPDWDSTHIPIGWVDTSTGAATKELKTRQFAVTDFFTIIC